MTIIDTRRTGHGSATTSRWLSLIILCIGFLMIVVDATIVNGAIVWRNGKPTGERPGKVLRRQTK